MVFGEAVSALLSYWPRQSGNRNENNKKTWQTRQKLPQVVKENQIPPVVDEWKLYQHQVIPEDW